MSKRKKYSYFVFLGFPKNTNETVLPDLHHSSKIALNFDTEIKALATE